MRCFEKWLGGLEMLVFVKRECLVFVPKYDLYYIKKRVNFSWRAKFYGPSFDQKMAKFPTLAAGQGACGAPFFPSLMKGAPLALTKNGHALLI